MKPSPRQTKTPDPAGRDRSTRDRDKEREDRRDREWRIGAAQMAAPSTRRWRRSGTFGQSS
jgi:hypothetical protein